jgi:O-antigen/teichoic acid export membrane protein
MASRITSLASDTAIYGIFTVIGRFLTFLLTPIYTNYLTQTELGDIIYIYSIIAFLNVVYSFGMESAFFRFFDKNDPKTGKKSFSHAFLSIVFVSLTFSGLIYFNAGYLGSLVSDLENAEKLVRIAAFIPFLDACILIPYAYLRMMRKAKQFALTRFAIIIIAVALNFLFVVFMNIGAEGILYAQLIASFVGLIIFLKLIYNHLELKINKSQMKEMLWFGLPTVPAGLSAIILQVADRPLLKEITGSSEVLAVYGTNYRLGIPMMIFITIFEYAWKPFYLSHYTDVDAKKLFSRILTYFSTIALLIFLITSFFIEYVVTLPFIGGRFINPAYWEGLSIIPIILFAYFLNGLGVNFSAGFLIEKKTKWLPVAIASAAVVKIALNFALVPIMGYMGSAWATLIAYGTSAGILYYLSRKFYPVDYDWQKLALIIIGALLLFFSSKYLSVIIDSITAIIIIKLLLIGVFVSLVFIFKIVNINQLKEILKNIKKRNTKIN